MHTNCFHCGLPVDKADLIEVEINGDKQPMCCQGCAAVSRAIVDAGLHNYYQQRSAFARRGEILIPDELRNLSDYDHPKVQASFVRRETENRCQAALILEGITCSACIWLNQKYLKSLSGIIDVDVNYSTHRAWVSWDDDIIKLSQILEAIAAIGYRAHPYDPRKHQLLLERQRKLLLKRLGVAGIFGMQVMVLAIALYGGTAWGIEQSFYDFFRKTSLLLSLPVVFYSARGFTEAAWRDLCNRQAGMDVPVSIGIILAFTASVYATILGEGEIYFDSVCMFTFLLLAARYLESSIRLRAANSLDLVTHSPPLLAEKMLEDDRSETVLAAELARGDHIRIRPGSTLPADGILLSSHANIDESIISGESMPVDHKAGSHVIAGSINTNSPIEIEVTRCGQYSTLSLIQQLLDRTQNRKPAITDLADHIASYFVLGLLVISTIIGALWAYYDPERWLPVVVSVLIVACPCALSLATPAAMTAAISKLMKSGIVISQGKVIETLPDIKRFVFDKTGTLTRGNPTVTRIMFADHSSQQNYDEKKCLAIAAALEQYSEHPLANAFKVYHDSNVIARQVTNYPGRGLSGIIDNTCFFIGSPEFLEEQCLIPIIDGDAAQNNDLYESQSVIALAQPGQLLCLFAIGDSLRDDADLLIRDLHMRTIKVDLLSGDRESSVASIAQQLGIEHYLAAMSPQQKLDTIQKYQACGERVVMVGDGINDAAVLAAADVSIAMSASAPLAAASADVYLLGEKLTSIGQMIDTSKLTTRIIKQNLIWALSYNMLAIPAAALGWVPPWLAATGMSVSSFVVVLNAMRIR